ncbi:UNVERIFIED_CONTAM: hypothetical protein FKN15_077582 [Acipenser sinensis]
MESHVNKHLRNLSSAVYHRGNLILTEKRGQLLAYFIIATDIKWLLGTGSAVEHLSQINPFNPCKFLNASQYRILAAEGLAWYRHDDCLVMQSGEPMGVSWLCEVDNLGGGSYGDCSRRSQGVGEVNLAGSPFHTALERPLLHQSVLVETAMN